MKRRVILWALLITSTGILAAHGNEQHIMGTVSNISDSAITVKTADGNTVVVLLTPQTTFSRDGQSITARQIQPGSRIVVHAKKNGDKLEATTVQIGAPPTKNQMNRSVQKEAGTTSQQPN